MSENEGSSHEHRVVVIAMDGSDQAKYAFECEYN